MAYRARMHFFLGQPSTHSPMAFYFRLRIVFIPDKHAAHEDAERHNERDDQSRTKYEEFHEQSLFKERSQCQDRWDPQPDKESVLFCVFWAACPFRTEKPEPNAQQEAQSRSHQDGTR